MNNVQITENIFSRNVIDYVSCPLKKQLKNSMHVTHLFYILFTEFYANLCTSKGNGHLHVDTQHPLHAKRIIKLSMRKHLKKSCLYVYFFIVVLLFSSSLILVKRKKNEIPMYSASPFGSYEPFTDSDDYMAQFSHN